jgi:hypothetical protein
MKNIKMVPIKFIGLAQSALEEKLPKSRVILVEDGGDDFYRWKNYFIGKNSLNIIIAPKEEYPQYYI